MTWTSAHTNWFSKTSDRLKTSDGKNIEIWEFQYLNDERVFQLWAKHFRNHYCSDDDIDFLKGKRSRKDYLNDIKFPSASSKLGPGIRAGDFGEIIIADFLEFLLGYKVPRFRWCSKMIRDESPKGCDVIGYKFDQEDEFSESDNLIIYESKTEFSRTKENRMQNAINDSSKDHIRIDESLNYIKQKFYEKNNKEEALLIERFQSPVDLPYKESYGAALVVSDDLYEVDKIQLADCEKIPIKKKSDEFKSHPQKDKLKLLIFKGPEMMTLVHELYRRAADEA